jgi:hypothetical protein
MAVRVAEGEIVIKTHGASRNTNRLTSDLSSLSKQSRETGNQLSHTEKEIQRFGLGIVSATSNASALSASLRFLGKTGGIALGFAVAARGAIGFVQEMQSLRFESEKTNKSLEDAFKTGMLSKSSEEARSAVKGMDDQILQLNQDVEKIDLWRKLRKVAEPALKKMGVNVDLHTNDPEKALASATKKRDELKALQDRLKLQERVIANSNLVVKAMEEQRSIDESTLALDMERSKYITGEQKAGARKLQTKLGEEDSSKTIYLKQSETLTNAQEQYNIQKEILKKKEEELSVIEAIATREQDRTALEAVREERNKSIVASKLAEANLIKATRSEEGKLLQGSIAGRQALENASKRKAIVDKQAAFKSEEQAVNARMASENAQRKAKGISGELNSANIRDMMAEEAVGLRTPPILGKSAGIPGETPNGLTQAGGLRSQMSVEHPFEGKGAGALPTSGGAVPPIQAGKGTGASLDDLVKAFKDLASTIKQAPLVTSAA